MTECGTSDVIDTALVESGAGVIDFENANSQGDRRDCFRINFSDCRNGVQS